MLGGRPHWGALEEKMKKSIFCIFLVIFGIGLYAQDYTLKSLNFVLTKEVNDIFQIGVTLDSSNSDSVISMYKGTVVDLNRESNNSTNLGKYVEVVTEFNYFYLGEEKKVDVHMVYSNLSYIPEEISVGYKIETQTSIGVAKKRSSPLMKNNDLMISMYTLDREFYLEYYTSQVSNKVLDLHWYSIVNVLYRRIPNPDIFQYEEINTEKINFESLEINKRIRFYYKLEEYPSIQDPVYVKLFMSAALVGLIPNYQNRNYSYVEYIKKSNSKILLLWPEAVVNDYKEKKLKGKEIYLFGRKVAQNDDGILIVLDLSSDLSPEEIIKLQQ